MVPELPLLMSCGAFRREIAPYPRWYQQARIKIALLLHFNIIISRTSTMMRTRMIVNCLLSLLFLATSPRLFLALSSVPWCRSTCSSTSSNIFTWSSNSLPICMLRSRCLPMLSPKRSNCSSWSCSTFWWYSCICWLSNPVWSGGPSGSSR